MMADQNSFLCECGRVIGRMYERSKYLPWNADAGDPRHKGVSCGGCHQNWIYLPSKGKFVDVRKCCKEFECEC